jgi:hypothetical protein
MKIVKKKKTVIRPTPAMALVAKMSGNLAAE